MNWIELLLSAIALLLAAAAFRKAWATDPRKDSKDVAILQAFQDLRATLDALPGRIADETSASPLREAVEGVRESVRKLGESMGEHLARQTEAQARSREILEQGFDGLARGQQALLEGMESTAKTGSTALQGTVASLEGVVAKLVVEVSRIPTAVEQGSAEVSRTVVASAQKSTDTVVAQLAKVNDAVANGSAEVSRSVSDSADKTSEKLAMAVSASLPVPDTTGTDLLLAKLEALLSGIREVSELQRQARQDSLSRAQTRESQADLQLEALQALQSRLDAVSLLEPISGSLASLGGALETLSRELPVRIAQESAARPAPHPELEELAMAVRESGHLRGDVGRQVAEAVGRVGQQLSESGARAEESREKAGVALDQALESLRTLASDLSGSLSPLAQALTGHGQVVAPLAAALDAARDRLEEASATLRANQVEFSSSVELFTNGAQELQSGLALFAREGEKDGAEDPRAAQKALLEALERLLGGFAESLKAHLSESDLRLRETLAELAARLPAPQA